MLENPLIHIKVQIEDALYLIIKLKIRNIKNKFFLLKKKFKKIDNLHKGTEIPPADQIDHWDTT